MNNFFMVMMFVSMLGACFCVFWGMARDIDNKPTTMPLVLALVGLLFMLGFLVAADRTRPEPKPESFICTPQEGFTRCIKEEP